MSGSAPILVYRLKLSLLRISPMIWRRLLVRSDLTLFGLHRAIQSAFGWEDYHLHAFKVHGRRFGTQWTGDRHHLVEDGRVLRELTLADLSLRLRQRMLYEYDFGDFWQHEIRVETREQLGQWKPYPVCVDSARAEPPEDIGGPDGYEKLLERLDDVRFDQEDDLYGLLDEDSFGDNEEGDGDEWTLIRRRSKLIVLHRICRNTGPFWLACSMALLSWRALPSAARCDVGLAQSFGKIT